MGSGHRRHPIPHLLLLLVLLPLTARYASAQSPPSNSSNNNNNSPYFTSKFNPSMAIIIVVLISAFFFLGFFSIYIRQCAGERRASAHGPTSVGRNSLRSRRQRGLDPEILATFPTLVYSDVKAHKIGKGTLECAVCLSEFDDDETLRLLPQCSHVFHHDCIDAWLSAHVTCPVCRQNLTEPIPDKDPLSQDADAPESAAAAQEEQDQVAIDIDSAAAVDDERKAEIANLEQFVNMKRAKSRARPARFPRSHSTGHSLVVPGENLDRFTLRLPENIRREIVMQAERLQRTKSLVVFPTEGSSRRGFRGGSTKRAKSIRLGRSDRWGSFLMRANWGRRSVRGENDGGSMSARGGGGGGGSTRRSVIAPFDCYGAGAKPEVKDNEAQSSTAALNRV